MIFSLFKHKDDGIQAIYEDILASARQPVLYTDYGVTDNPHGRFQMIALHATPYYLRFLVEGEKRKSQKLFDKIFSEIELSFREIGVGDLAVPKKMKRYMKDFNGIIQAHAVANANHADITRRNVFGDDGIMNDDFKSYIERMFA